MQGTYRGYVFYKTRNDEALWCDYSVWSSEKERVACSSEAYFYEVNAMIAAKEDVDKRLNHVEKHTCENGEDTEHVEDVIL